MNSITAKLSCSTVTLGAGYQKSELLAVTSDSTDNKGWSKWTPSASVTIMITNPIANGFFVPGKEYMLTFTPAE